MSALHCPACAAVSPYTGAYMCPGLVCPSCAEKDATLGNLRDRLCDMETEKDARIVELLRCNRVLTEQINALDRTVTNEMKRVAELDAQLARVTEAAQRFVDGSTTWPVGRGEWSARKQELEIALAAVRGNPA